MGGSGRVGGTVFFLAEVSNNKANISLAELN